jgi:hypothetical protein
MPPPLVKNVECLPSDHIGTVATVVVANHQSLAGNGRPYHLAGAGR